MVLIDCALRRFKVADRRSQGQEALRLQLQRALQPLADPKGGLVNLVDDPRQADWVVRLDQGKARLVEASGNRPPFALPAPDSPDLGKALRQSLEKIYRARNLVAVSSRFESERARGASAVDVEVEVLRHKNRADLGEVVPGPGGRAGLPARRSRSRSAFHNNSPKMKVDVTLLVVGSDFEISAFYPQPGELGQSLDPGKTADDPAAVGRDQQRPAVRPRAPGGHRDSGEQPPGGFHGPGAGRTCRSPGLPTGTEVFSHRWGNSSNRRCSGPAPAAR